MDEKEKSFEIGQRVRIIGPDNFNRLCHLGECFVIEEKDNPAWGWIDRKRPYGYSRHGCPHIFPASSLELVEPEYDCPQGIRCPYIPKSHRLEMVEQRCMAIEKRLQALEGKAQVPQDARVPEEDSDYELYNTICKKPGSGVYDLAKEMGWSSDKACGSLRRLVKDGWVMAVLDGRSMLKIVPVKWHEFLTPEEIEEFKKGDLQ